jgi:hypothetical protein
VSVASARRDYGVVCSDEGVLDFAASDALRRRLLGRDDGPVIRVAAA